MTLDESSRQVAAQRGIFRRKPIEADADSGLERSIGLWQLTAIGLGAIIGAGIFALAGPVAKTDAGPAVTVSFLIAGVASACAALSYAEFGGLIPAAGSAYTYGYAVLGESVGWFIGWTCCWSTPRSWPSSRSASRSTSPSSPTRSGSTCPPGCSAHPGPARGTGSTSSRCCCCCLGVAWLLNRGIRTSTRIETMLVGVKIAIVLAVIVVGAFFVDTDNLTPYFPYGLSGAATGQPRSSSRSSGTTR